MSEEERLREVSFIRYELEQIEQAHLVKGEEEKLQEEIGYPGIAEHKKKHEELRQVVKDLYAMLEEQEGPTAAFVESVNENVTNWLYNHIRGFDRSVAEYRFMRDNESRI